MALPPRDQRHPYLRFEGLYYTDTDIIDFKERLELMDEGLRGRMLMEHRDAQGQSVFTSRSWRQLFEIRGPLVHELILEFFSTFRFGEVVLDLDITGALQFQSGRAESVRQIPDKEDLSAYWIRISSVGYFLGTTPSYTSIRDLMLRLCHMLITCSIARRGQAPEKVTVTDLFYLRGMDVGSINITYLLARYLRLFASGMKRGVMISGVRLQIYVELDDTWAWVALRPERQQVATAGTPKASEDAPVSHEGAPAIPAPVQAPQPLPPVVGLAQTMS
ncbi:hypothetical protein Tco_1283411 [Tanacetum coccineum]